MVVAMMTACGSKNNTESVTTEEPSDEIAKDSVSTSKTVSNKDVDAVTSATNVDNAPTFNGVMALSPQHRATMSLTMGGRIHTLKVIEGQMVGKGQVIATIDNPDFIQLQHRHSMIISIVNTSGKPSWQRRMQHRKRNWSRPRPTGCL